MRRALSAVGRYFHWRNDCLLKPPYFPLWCDTGAANTRESAARRTLRVDGAVEWRAENGARLPFADHLEMSGFFCSSIISYGAAKNGALRLHRHAVFPMLRTLPNDTRGSLSHNFLRRAQSYLCVDGSCVGRERLRSATLDGMLTLLSETERGVTIERTLFPAVHHGALLERVTLRSADGRAHQVEICPSGYRRRTCAVRSVEGAYTLLAVLADEAGTIRTDRRAAWSALIDAKKTVVCYTAYCAVRAGEALSFSAPEEERARREFLAGLSTRLRLETPDRLLNAAMEFAKIRACESIFRTKNGLMHSPGGGSFYAALWTNDQCEYTNPLFPFIGYPAGLEEAENSFRLFAARMDPALSHPLVSSIVAEGDGVWNGAGDRGDGAMFAYGAARYALARGDEAIARRLWDGVVWGIEYSLRHKNASGVIESDSDELENRFPSGNANLFTSCLVCDALISAAYLAEELNVEGAAARYRAEAAALETVMERYFGARVEGYDTYRYYEGNEVLRAWICVPLTVGIFRRAEGTLRALWSDRLWTEDGLRTQAGCDTFWDRATLFALRGVFAAGDRENALDKLTRYAARRLLGGHAPYAVEAWPEGNQKHLSAESALFARVFTEGLFGIRPTGFRQFDLTPQLPNGWDRMALRGICAFGTEFDIEIQRDGGGICASVLTNGTRVAQAVIQNGETLRVRL